MTDGHTRAAAAVRAGLTSVPTVSERDDLNWDLYRTCVSECLRRGVRSPSDLTGRILSREDYRLKWDRWCDLIREEPLRLELRDEEWPYLGTDHDRVIVRAILVDDRGFFHFVRADRDDDFGKAVLIETSGGGVEAGEDLRKAVLRELREELGAEAEIVCELGTVSDYYNLIFRHNINHYFLCRAVSFGKNDLTEDERDRFHLSPLCLSFEDAVREYETRACTKLGRLIANRELPVLRRAEEFVRCSIR
ncbi:MAG: NUDIX hydrolase [Clostridia bacterium]|nr:NUDIX hydrolase [Clostridia bacterium]